MDENKARQNFDALAAKRKQLAADIDANNAQLADARERMGAAVLDDPNGGDKVQAEINKLETKAAQLNAAAVELAKRQDAAAIEIANAKRRAAVSRFNDLNAALETGTRKHLDTLQGVQVGFVELARVQSELADLQRAYPDMPPATSLLGVGYANIAASIANDLESFAPIRKVLN